MGKRGKMRGKRGKVRGKKGKMVVGNRAEVVVFSQWMKCVKG